LSEANGGKERESMDVRVRPVRRTDSSDVVRLSLSAWEPVFASLRKALGPRLFAKLQPD